MKHTLSFFFACLICLIANSQWSKTISGQTAEFSSYFTNSGSDTTLVTSLVVKQNGSIIYDYGKILITNANKNDSSELVKILYDKFDSLHNTYTLSNLQANHLLLTSLRTSAADSATNEQLMTLSFQGLNMFLSVSAGLVRSYNGSTTFSISPHFLLGLSHFRCEEEILINVTNFKNWLSNRPDASTEPGVGYFLNSLNNISGTKTLKQINSYVRTYYSTGGRLYPTGGMCGCCGNYSGPCYYWNTACLIHDYACQFCIPRDYCFPGCRVSLCKGNTIPGFYFSYPYAH